MCKRILAILLVFLMFFSSFEKMSILIYYQAYQNYIAAYLCENRFNPNSHCHGQCYLMKKMREAEKREATPIAPDIQKNDFIVDTFEIETTQKQISSIDLPGPTNQLNQFKGYLPDVFRPPKYS